MSRVHVAFYIPDLTVGGAERVTVNIANGFAERGYRVDLVLSTRTGENLQSVSETVRVVDLQTPSVPALGVLASVPGLRSYLRRERPAVLFSAMTYANVAAVLAAAAAGVETKVIPTEHNMFGTKRGAKERVTRTLARRLYPRADHVVAVSDGVADSVRLGTDVDPEDVSVLYNPMDIGSIREAAHEPIDDEWLTSPAFDTIVTVGRLEAQKDHETLLRAFERVHAERPNARLVLVGTGSRLSELRALSADLGLEDVVSIPGYVENVYPYIRLASAFALSSRHEGLPTVLIEALACGCPIVSTDCPSGPREILDGGVYGRLVPVGDPDALAEGLLTTLASEPDPDRLVARAAEFDTAPVIDRYTQFVDDLLGTVTDPRLEVAVA